jgi:hypothetical protein
VKITAFRAEVGQSLLVAGGHGGTILVDGATQAEYSRFLAPSLKRYRNSRKAIDRVCVTSPVRGRLDGMRQLFDDEAAWRVYGYQRQAGNSRFPRPAAPRPPAIAGGWFNSVHDLSGSVLTRVGEMLAVRARLLSLGGGGADSREENETVAAIADSLKLTKRLNQLNIPLNPEFMGGLVYPRAPQSAISMAGMRVQVLGPSARDIERSRAEWNTWLQETSAAHAELTARVQLDLSSATAQADAARDPLLRLAAELRSKESALPGFPALLLLVVERDKSLLITGELHADRILSGLELHGLLKAGGAAHFSVMQVPGSEHAIHQDFFARVTADHYLFASCGAEKPALSVLDALFSVRLTTESTPRFTVSFAGSSGGASPEHQSHVQELETFVRTALRNAGKRAKCRFMTRGNTLEISL